MMLVAREPSYIICKTNDKLTSNIKKCIKYQEQCFVLLNFKNKFRFELYKAR